MNNGFDSADRHIYLYAKNWYEITDSLNDLKVLVGKRCAIDPNLVTQNDVENILLEIVYDIFEREGFHQHGFIDFVFKCRKNSIIDTALGIIAISEMKKHNIDLGKPDSNILSTLTINNK